MTALFAHTGKDILNSYYPMSTSAGSEVRGSMADLRKQVKER